ncbi:MAG: hypothetical protein ABSG82_06905 [Sedimentisphaerales bacterium]|jgi:hypothetical protein
MISIILTAIGLVLNMIGVILLFFYAPPIFTILPGGKELLTYTENSEQAEQKEQIVKRRQWISSIALITIFVGFLFQLVGVFF